MSTITFAILMLIVSIFIPAHKCTMKFQLTILFFTAIGCGLAVLKETYIFELDLCQLLLLDTGRMEASLSVLGIYFFVSSHVIIFIKSLVGKRFDAAGNH